MASYKSIGRFVFALSILIVFSSAAFNQQPKLTPPTKTINPVNLAVTVKDDRGEFVTGLPQDSFEISVDKSLAKIISFRSEQTPASIGILFDASRSASRAGTETGRNLAVWRDALAGFMAAGNQSNEYFLLGFNDRPQLLVDWTSDHKKILDRIVGLQQVGDTAFYDACYLGIDKAQGGSNRKRALLVISDGVDNNSRYSFAELSEFLKESEVLLYAVNFPSSREVSGSTQGQSILNELSSTTGGALLYNRGEGPLKLKTVEKTLQILAAELRSQYLIGIEPVVPASDDNWHKIKVKVTPSNSSRPAKQLTARTRLGYYHR